MRENITLRIARADDARALLEIYRPYVLETAITFEYEPPSEEEFRSRIERTLESYPYLVAECGGVPVGYAYASRYRERAAYAWDAELSVYLAPDAQGDGVGGCLYDALLGLLRAQGYVNVYAVVTHPNERSEAFHRKLGFSPCALFHETGYKFDRWIDVAELVRRIGEMGRKAAPPVKFPALAPEAVQKALAIACKDQKDSPKNVQKVQNILNK